MRSFLDCKNCIGGIEEIKNNGRSFGFFNVDIIAPDNLEQPILQTIVLTKDGYRTVAALGQWNDVIFSEEMYNAEKYGYKFIIKNGYLFDRENIFKEYLTNIYEIKQT